MTDLIIILSIVMVGFIITTITSFNDFYDKKQSGLKKVTIKGRVFVIVAAIAISLYIYQYVQTDKVIESYAEPFLSVCKENPIELPETSKEYYKFNISLCNSEAPSRNIFAELFIVSVNKENKMKYCKYFNLFQSDAQLDKGAKVIQQVLVPNIEELQLCYFQLKANWTNISETRQYKIDNIFHYNFNTNMSGGITSAHEIQIREFLNKALE